MSLDVLVVGAGPSGLVLANVLADHGVDFRIVDRKPGPVRQSRAAIVHVRTLELLDRLGLAREAVRRGIPTTRVEVYERGRPAADFPLPHALILEQDRTEELLLEGLRDHDQAVAWDTQLLELTDGAARLRRPDGTEETVRARWVVGADGAGSAVRHSAGLGFAGKTYAQTGLLADVELDLPAGPRLVPGTLRLNLTRGGFVGMVELGSGRHRLFGALPKDFAARPAKEDEDTVSHEAYATTSLADLQRWFDEYFFVDARLRRAEWTALFRIHSRIAERFRAGNVFLVGDAAHIHSPAGGQGMNLGIGDAYNLGWKLALVANGHAKPELLDTYEAERCPVARKVLRGSDRGFALEATPNPVATWARAHLAPRILRPLLRLPAAQAAISRLFSQTWITYRTGLTVGRGPRPGDRAAPHPLTGGTRHSLLLFGGDTYRRAVEDVLRPYRVDVSVQIVPSTERDLHRAYGVTKPALFLIRPDGHVAYRGSPTKPDALAAHLAPLYPQIRP